ncbi:MAG: circularly permuted type 2 ATP-grasp protein, partial [Roseibium sp.]|uniref:circularly permuted type 2 ATP-grasp protein n=1 Tax=Roseibium sp. TaxID=1936156 RepID=UPI003297BD01
MLDDAGNPRSSYAKLAQWLEDKPPNFLKRKSREAETIFRRLGITFAVYGAEEATERLIPFDPIPRVISPGEWRRLSAGIDQRVRALNAFLHDIYHRQEIIRAGRIPADLILQNEAFLPEMVGHDPARKVYAHIIGTDLVRVSENEFYVLEDNTRTPSGVSYMMENRETMMHLFPELFQSHRVAPVDRYPELLRQTLESVSPNQAKPDQTVVLLTPGI